MSEIWSMDWFWLTQSTRFGVAKWLSVSAVVAVALVSPRIAQGALVVVFDGSKFHRVDEERLATMRIIEWRIDGYTSAERRAAGKSSATMNGSTAEQCLMYVRKDREEFQRVCRSFGKDPNQEYYQWRFASVPYAVVDRKAFEVEAKAEQASREREEKLKRDQEALKAEAESIRAKALAQQQEAQRQLEKATLDRQRRENEARVKEQARVQAEKEQQIISKTVAKLESLRAQEEAITGAFRQIAELIQAKMEQDAREEEAREAREEARQARREAERLAEREQELQERLERARQAAEEPLGFNSSTASGGSSDSGSTSEPLAAPDPEEANGAGAAIASSAPSTPARTSFAALLQSSDDERGDTASGGISGALGSLASLFGGSAAPAAPSGGSAMSALFGDDQSGADDRPSAFRQLFSKDPEVAKQAKESLKDQALWWLVENKYYEEHDTRVVGADAAGKMDKMRRVESGADYLQNEVLDESIPESVRIQGDAWRLLFLRGAGGDLMGHVTGHVDFAERWVFHRIDRETADTAAPPQGGVAGTLSTTSGAGRTGGGPGGGTGTSQSAPMTASDRAIVSAIEQRTRQANTATDVQARTAQLRLLLQESTTLPSHPEARRGVLYLRAAAALDLQDRDACASARRALSAERADQAMSARERRLIEELDKLSKE